MLQNIVLAILDIVIPMIILINPIKNKIKENQKINDFIKKNKYELLMYTLLVIGCLVRTIAIDIYPLGFGGDEASAGYEAYSLYKYGVDRHLKSFPVHFIAWGSGQNVLYSYMSIPFIAILGLSVFSFRLPMAIIGCATLFIIYYLCKEIENKKIRAVTLFIFAICPWHIMKSRWALESNLFPDLFFMGFALLLVGLRKEKMKYFYIGMLILRNFSIFIWNIIFFLICICNNSINYFTHKKEDKNKKCITFLGNNRSYCYTYNIICGYKYI